MRDLSQKTTMVIPTGGSAEEDLRRAGDAINYNYIHCGGQANYLVSGIGPDINSVLGYDVAVENPNFHPILWKYMCKNSREIFGVDIRSLNSRDNVLNSFPKEQKGKYVIFSDSNHGKRLRMLEWKLKLTGRMSRKVNIQHVSTGDSSRGKLIDTAAYLKSLVLDW